MIAYKFLCAGGVGPFSGYRWPLPSDGGAGPWVAGAPDAVPCRRAVHACRVADLPWWLRAELWEVELEGTVTAGRHKVMAPRGRLLRRVAAWDADCTQRFADVPLPHYYVIWVISQHAPNATGTRVLTLPLPSPLAR